MSDNSSGTNSWTFLTSEEPGVENVAVSQGGTCRSGSGPLQTEQLGPGLTQRPHLPDNHADKTLNLEPLQVTHLDSGEDAAVPHAADVKADPVPSSDLPVESLSTLTSDPSEPGCSVDHGEGDHLAPDSELLSDTIAPTIPSPGSAHDPDATPQDVEELSLKDEMSEPRRTLREEESKPNFETSEEKVNDCAGVRRRNLSLLTPQHHRDEDEEDDVDEQHIRPFPREDGFGFSLNKCIFGALVLLGLGTVFFSAGESDVGELKDPVLQKEWFNPDAHGDAHAAVQPSEILQRLAKGSKRIAELQAQLQQQEEQLKAAQVQVEEGFKEQTRREELEVENQQMKAELDRLPALQKQLEQETQRMKRVSEGAEKDLQSLPAMQKALEFLKSQMAELSQNAASLVPSVEHEVAANQGGKGPEHKKRQGKELEEKRRNEWKKDGRGKKVVEKPRMERDSEKTDGKKKGDREKRKVHQEEDKKVRGKAERKDGKDERGGKGNGKRRKDGGEKRRFSQDGGKGDEGDDAKWKKEKRGELDSGREELKEKCKHRREWKKVEQAGGNEQKEGTKAWNEGKEQEGDKERGADRKDNLKSKGKCDKAQKEKMGKGENNNNHKGNGEKLWSGQERGWLKHEGSAAWLEDMKSKDEHHQARRKYSGKDKPRHSSSDEVLHYSHSDRRYSKDHAHDDYWTKQRDRMRHYHGLTEGCTDVTACAHAEGLDPVRQSDFEALLLSYLTRLLGPEEQMSKKEDLNKLVQEFFTDGLFIHDQMPFGEFVEDVADILEDLAEDEGDEEMEDEMEGFVMDAMEKFAFPNRRRNEDKRKGVSG